MARTGQIKKVGAAVAGVLTISLIAGAVLGEGTSPAAPAAPMPPIVTPAPFSPECQGGSTEIVTESPLPHVAAALQKRRTVRILAIGNSTGRRQGGFTRQIERILKQVVKGADVVIINRGVSGELAANASLRIKNEVAISEPDLVIWQVGTDDALAFVPLDEVRETVESTIKWLKEHNVDVVLAGLQYVDRVAQDDNYYRMRELLRDIAAKEHVMIIRRYEAMQFIAAAQSAGGGYGPDEFERTEAGYNCLAQYLASAITVGAFGKGMSGRPLRGQGPPGTPPQQQAQPPQQRPAGP
jgi:acyl-CoA thioesterase-1